MAESLLRSAAESINAVGYLSLRLMAAPTVSLRGDEHTVSPVTSSKPSMISFDSTLSETSSVVHEVPRATMSWVKHASSLLTGSEMSTPACIYSGAGAADDSFVRHHKYFFKDGNVTFLVRRVQP